MADQLSLRGGTTTEHATFTGANKEVTVDTTKKTLVVNDGATVGGHPLMRENASNSALALGSAGTPSLKFTGDTNTGIYSPGADQVSIATNGTERLRVDNAGQIEAVSLGTAAAPTFSFTGDPNTGIYSPGADQLAVATNGTGRLFIGANPHVGIGVTPNASSASSQVLEVGPSTFSSIGNDSYQGSNWFYTGAAYVYKNSAAATQYVQASGNHIWLTAATGTAGNAATFSERLRITSTGLVGIGTSNPGGGESTEDNAGVALSPTLDINGNLVFSSATPYIKPITKAEFGRSLYIQAGDTRQTNYDGGHLYLEAGGQDPSWGGTANGGNVYIDGGQKGGAGTDGNIILGSTRGRVGIGTTSPGQPLEVLGTIYSQNNATTIVHFQAADTGAATDEKTWRIAQSQRAAKSIQIGVAVNDAGSVANAAINIVRSGATLDNIQFATGSGSERARIDSSGRLLIGTSSARSNFFPGGSWFPTVQIETATNAGRGLSIVNNRTDNNGPQITLGKANGSAVGSTSIVLNNDTLGAVSFTGADGTNFIQGARIDAQVDGTPGADDMPGRLVFSTTADGASSPTERMRITSDAYVRLASGTGGIQFNGDTAAANALDDYEEGTFTPTISGHSSNPTITYTSQSGTYTKIGRQVTVTFKIVVNTSSGGSGGIVLSSTPFVISGEYVASILTSGINFGTSATQLTGRTDSSNRLRLYGMLNDGALVDTAVSSVAAGDTFQGTMSYFV